MFSFLKSLSKKYTELKIDEFEDIFPDVFDNRNRLKIYYVNVVGMRHYNMRIATSISVRDEVTFVSEPWNEYDDEAVAVYYKGEKVGHVENCGTWKSAIFESVEAGVPVLAKVMGTGYKDGEFNLRVAYARYSKRKNKVDV